MAPQPASRPTAEQQALLYELVPRYHQAKQNGTLSDFWPVLWDLWFRHWPMVPELIQRGILPPEAANYKLTDEQTAIFKAEKLPRLELVQEYMVEVHDAWLGVKLSNERREEWNTFFGSRSG